MRDTEAGEGQSLAQVVQGCWVGPGGDGGGAEDWHCPPCWCAHSYVGHFKSRREREAELGARALEFTNIYVKSLHADMDEQGLQDLFSQFGGRGPQGRRGSYCSSPLAQPC
jgi:hypothetical protein